MKNKITIIPGDGIGPEIMKSVINVLDHLSLNFDYEYVNAGQTCLDSNNDLIPSDTLDSISRNKVVLKAPIGTPIGKGFKSVNVTLRQEFDLYSNIRVIKGHSEKFGYLDLVIFRENTEGLYIGMETEVDVNTVHAIKHVTYKGCYRIIKDAFEFAKDNNRKKVTIVHKANILKKADGMFLDIAKDVSKEYNNIEFEDVIVDNMCMQLVLNPQQFDVIVAQNLYGDILSDLCAGLIGGLGLVPGANIGQDIAIFEAVHGTAPDIAGKNLANPTALLLSACMMLEYLGYGVQANQIKDALELCHKAKETTRDLGGSLSTVEFTNNLIRKLGD